MAYHHHGRPCDLSSLHGRGSGGGNGRGLSFGGGALGSSSLSAAFPSVGWLVIAQCYYDGDSAALRMLLRLQLYEKSRFVSWVVVSPLSAPVTSNQPQHAAAHGGQAKIGLGGKRQRPFVRERRLGSVQNPIRQSCELRAPTAERWRAFSWTADVLTLSLLEPAWRARFPLLGVLVWVRARSQLPHFAVGESQSLACRAPVVVALTHHHCHVSSKTRMMHHHRRIPTQRTRR